MATVVSLHPTYFVGVGLISTELTTSALMSTALSALSLGLSGFAVFVGPDMSHPMDDLNFWGEFYKLCEERDVGIWLHPNRPQSHSDYKVDNKGSNGSKYAIWNSYGWIYDTSVAMVHIAGGGVFERYPKIKIVGHHGGGMVKVRGLWGGGGGGFGNVRKR
jgi:uncharacterized protein